VILHPLETILSVALCAAGTAIIVLGNRQFRIRDIDSIPLVSPRTKHVVGIFLILVAVVIFISQFIVGPRKGSLPLRRAHFGITQLHDASATDAFGYRHGYPTAGASQAKTSPT
jgi:hypothetical protein